MRYQLKSLEPPHFSNKFFEKKNKLMNVLLAFTYLNLLTSINESFKKHKKKTIFYNHLK